MLLVEVDARAAWLHLAAYRGGHAAPYAVDFGEIFGDRADRAVLLDQGIHYVVERLKHTAMNVDAPVAVRHDVMTGAGLGFCSRGELILLALRRDVIDVNFDVVLLTPFVAQLGQGIVRARHPMVPAAERELAGGVAGPDIGGRQNGRAGERRRLQCGAARNSRSCHCFPPVSSLIGDGTIYTIAGAPHSGAPSQTWLM